MGADKIRKPAGAPRHIRKDEVLAYLAEAPDEEVPGLMMALNARVDELRPPGDEVEDSPELKRQAKAPRSSKIMDIVE
jgi:hypothetical protein